MLYNFSRAYLPSASSLVKSVSLAHFLTGTFILLWSFGGSFSTPAPRGPSVAGTTPLLAGWSASVSTGSSFHSLHSVSHRANAFTSNDARSSLFPLQTVLLVPSLRTLRLATGREDVFLCSSLKL